MRLIDCFAPLISLSFQDHAQAADPGMDPAAIQQQYLERVDQCRQRCDQQGYSQRQREDALFAVIAWIDEQRLCAPQADSRWLHLELQKVLFNTSVAGDEFYQRLAATAEEDSQLREVFAYCLILGFRGRMYDRPQAFADLCQQSFGCKLEAFAAELPAQLFAAGPQAAAKKTMLKRLSFSRASHSLLMLLLSLGILGGLFYFGQRSLETLYSSITTAGL
ncbi:DotU family type IV/VI secretion system protein [Desulfogranum mediterraneum]|uniref:DotU family type IV/VI secretion system protein n=1 Tax=Desulfogranum mediterraneum TaxID=160661 RepID=UPI00068888B6|nr:DotU family type IV/VI secretion system protein [Desulfogranum mediterraneum]